MHHPRLAAVILAAGRSSRMCAFKPLLPLHGKPLLQHAIDTLHAVGGFDPLLIVTGHNAEMLSPLIAAAGATAVQNLDYAAGEMLSSVQSAVRALPKDVDAFLLALADQPSVQPTTVRTLIQAWSAGHPRPPLAIPRYLGKRGHPLLLSAALRDEILSLPRGDTLRTVTHRHLTTAVQIDVDDPAVIADLDTPDDVKAAQSGHA